jgi:hypothetical protein
LGTIIFSLKNRELERFLCLTAGVTPYPYLSCVFTHYLILFFSSGHKMRHKIGWIVFRETVALSSDHSPLPSGSTKPIRPRDDNRILRYFQRPGCCQPFSFSRSQKAPLLKKYAN